MCIYHTSPAHVSESHPLTQSLIETLNSNEIFLEIEQQPLKKILICNLVKEDKNEPLFTLLLPLYTMEIQNLHILHDYEVLNRFAY